MNADTVDLVKHLQLEVVDGWIALPFFAGDHTPYMEFDRARMNEGLKCWTRPTTDTEREIYLQSGATCDVGMWTVVYVVKPGCRNRFTFDPNPDHPADVSTVFVDVGTFEHIGRKFGPAIIAALRMP